LYNYNKKCSAARTDVLTEAQTWDEAKANRKYMNLHVLVGTSVSCQRLFSAANFILTDLRKSKLLTMFEAILLLKVNRCDWDVYPVGRALGRTRGNMSAGNGDAGRMNDDLAGNNDQFDDIDGLDLFYE
jgi:hypothetical protein